MNLKIGLIFIFSTLACSRLYAQNQKISVSVSQQPLKTVFDLIQSESKYSILYSDEVVSDSVKVSIQAVRQPVSQILNTVLSNKGLLYSLTLKDLIIIRAAGQIKSAATQFQASISGRVLDRNDNPLSFVSVVLLKDSNYINGTSTDEGGNFKLPANFRQGESYTLKLTSVGYQPVTKAFTYPDTAFVKHLTLTEDKNTLNTITVTGKKTLITRKSDRYIINVENSFFADGYSALEVLQKSPGIYVSPDGSIRIKGNQSVMVMINDVVQRMSEDQLSEYLRALKSEDISKIEVISNPPSEFEASGSGGIIHIILKKSRKDGLNGNINTRYSQQVKKPYYAGSAGLDYKIKNLYFFGNAAYVKDKSYYLATYHIFYPNNSIYNSSTDRNNNNTRSMYRFGMAWDLSKSQSIGIQTMGNPGKYLQSFITDIDLTSPEQALVGQANSEWIRNPSLSSTTLNYSWQIDTLGSMLKLIGDYTSSDKTETNNFSSVYNDEQQNSIYRNNTPNMTDIYSFQADYTKALAHKLEFKGGVKYASTKRDNKLINEDYIDNEWVGNAARSNYFIYNENLLMGYASLEKTINNFSIKAGLRAEETFVKGNSVTSDQKFSKKYLGLFPSVFLVQTFNEEKGSAIHLNYSRRLQRPAFKELNPYRLQIDNFTYIIGNPDLSPQYTHNIEFGYNFLDGCSADIYFSSTKDVIAQLANPVNDNTLEYQFRNFNNSTQYGFSLYAPVKVLKWWTISNDAGIYHLAYTLNGFNIKQTSFTLRSSHSFTLKNIADIEASADYRSPYVSANSKVSYVFFTDIGLSKKILRNKGRLRLYVSDIFNTFREQDVTTYNNTRIEFYQKRPTRTIGVGFSYNFSSGKKFSNKKIEQSNDEEKRRIGN